MLGGAPLGGHIGSRSAELLDGRMSAQDEHRFRLHIGRCSSCAALITAHQDVRQTLRAAAMPDHLSPSESLLSGLLALGAPAPAPESVVRDLVDAANLPDQSELDPRAAQLLRGRLPNW